MRKTIIVTHENIVVPKRCRNPRNVPTQSEVEGSVAEISITDAPVAMIVTPDRADSQASNYWFVSKWGPTGEVRQYNAHLYTRLMNNYANKSDEVSTLTPELVFENEARRYAGWNAENTSLDVTKKQIADSLANLLFVDGEPWSTTREPVYKVWTSGWTSGGTYLSVYDDQASSRHEFLFRADELDLAKESATRVALERGDADSVTRFKAGEFDYIEVLIPSAVQFASCTKSGCCTSCGSLNQNYVAPATRSWKLNENNGDVLNLYTEIDLGDANTPYIECVACGHKRSYSGA